MVPVAVKAFKLMEGKQHMHNGEELKADDRVLLNLNQANAFKDKFVPVEPGANFKVYSEAEEKKFVETETNRRAARDAKVGVESHDS